MTAERARAYARVLALIEGDDELCTTEVENLRGAADALLFAEIHDIETCEALSESRAIAHAFVDAGRWRPERAHMLLTALRGCGPEDLPTWATPYHEQRFVRHSSWLRAQ
jgi:hypothetical protein